MRRILKWTAIGLVALVVVACITVYGVSEYRLRETFDIPLTPAVIPGDSGSLERGLYIAKSSAP